MKKPTTNVGCVCMDGGYTISSSTGRSSLRPFPVHHVPERVDVVRAAVLVVQIVRVLPDIETEDRLVAEHDRRVLVRGRADVQLAVLVEPETGRAILRDARATCWAAARRNRREPRRQDGRDG